MNRPTTNRPSSEHSTTPDDEIIQETRNPRRTLVLGATGYIGGRLVPRLLQAGHKVRVGVRRPEKLKQVPWAADVDVRTVDLDSGQGLSESLHGIDTVYYLVHSMGSGGDFEAHEAEAATRFAEAAASAGVSRIVYLGGLHPEGRELSKHMRSRANVGRILLDSAVDAIVFNAGIIIGSGSASFEMIRHLATTLRWMPAPDWVSNRVEPLSVRDALYYLVAAADVDEEINRSFEIGSRQILTYAQVMRTFAEVAGLKPRHVIALPLPAPTLSGIWVGLVTPLPFSLTLPLVQSLQEDAVASDQDVDAVIPPPGSGLIGFADAVRLALRREVEGAVDTNWDADAGELDEAALPLPNDPQWAGRRICSDERSATIAGVTAAEVWPVIEGIGGANGWYSWPLAWKIRGVWDKAVGGAGLNRGRRLPDTLRIGDPVDWWRVDELEPNSRLLLRAEMKVSGYAWLEFELTDTDGSCDYHQTATFIPSGVRGRLYWALVAPFHRFIFPAMAKNIAAEARRRAQSDSAFIRS
ncbi:SDR family oxidoreductase [Brevibacterium oceani]|uniref:SDR family oxidoreductase n=1 Tax=Brevibacterium oceani TaxID=358099 RepID=UPI0015E71F9B|nr:SDR family oxidoreductase [Brevibacterium oceani]